MANVTNDGAAAEVVTRSSRISIQIVPGHKMSCRVFFSADKASRLLDGSASYLDQIFDVDALSPVAVQGSSESAIFKGVTIRFDICSGQPFGERVRVNHALQQWRMPGFFD